MNHLEDYYTTLNRDFKKEHPDFPGLLSHTIITAITGVGKSHLLKSLLASVYKGYYNNIVLFSLTADFENYHILFDISKKKIIKNVNWGTISSEIEEAKDIYLNTSGEYLSLFIFDDIAKELRDNQFNLFISTCRHYGIRCVVLTQFIRQVDPMTRNQFGSIFFSPLVSSENLKAISESTTLSFSEISNVAKAVRRHGNEIGNKKGFVLYNKENPEKLMYILSKPDNSGIEFFSAIEIEDD